MTLPENQPISIHIAPGSQANGPVYLHTPVRIGSYSTLTHCSIGAFSYAGNFCELNSVEIGRYCQLGNHVCFIVSHPLDRLTTHPCSHGDIFPPPYAGSSKKAFSGKEPARIGNDVWIGHGAKIMWGVTIGDGAVIGAGSVVTKDIPPYAIVAGVPAKIIRYRFPPELIERIRQAQWWQYDITAVDLDWDSPERTLDSIEQLAATGGIRRHEMVYSIIEGNVAF
jgi:acetyltransferase-like isoleucine patch superfamily enzyme